MKGYEILEHRADLKIRIYGKTLPELFRNSLLAMQESLRPQLKKRPAQTKIRIQAEDLESLLIDFLSEINYLNEVNQEVYQRIFFEQFSARELEADLFGRKVRRFGQQIKGVTSHDLKIRKEENGIWQATVLFDI